MATIKSFTDISQSNILSEILPPESANMFFICVENREIIRINDNIKDYNRWDTYPAWSLAALLGVLPNENMLVKTTDGEYYCLAKDVMTKHYDNPVDACVDIIEELHRRKML